MTARRNIQDLSAEEWIQRLRLEPHPEGGYFRQTYAAEDWIPAEGLPAHYGGRRRMGTAILYLLTGQEVSHLHRLRSDELWHFHAGAPLSVHVFSPDSRYDRLCLGNADASENCFQAVVRAGHWFGATVDDADSFALVGCTVSPGFDWPDFELADRAAMLAAYPAHRALIERLTRP